MSKYEILHTRKNSALIDARIMLILIIFLLESLSNFLPMAQLR